MFVAQCWVGNKSISGYYTLFRILLLLELVRFVLMIFSFDFVFFLFFEDLLLFFLVSLLTSPAFRVGFGLVVDVFVFFFDT